MCYFGHAGVLGLDGGQDFVPHIVRKVGVRDFQPTVHLARIVELVEEVLQSLTVLLFLEINVLFRAWGEAAGTVTPFITFGSVLRSRRSMGARHAYSDYIVII